MTTVGALHTLPIWVWLLFTVLLIGIITLVYSEGNWRITFTFVGLALFVALLIYGVDTWFIYLDTHFIGQFDNLGIPFRKAGPGFAILLDAWPLWLVPMGLLASTGILIDWYLRRSPGSKKIMEHTSASATTATETQNTEANPLHNVSKHLELIGIKRELQAAQEKLAETIEIAEMQLDKTQQLEATLEHLKNDQQKTIAELEEQIATLNTELELQQSQKEDLTSLTLQQSEEIKRLKMK